MSLIDKRGRLFGKINILDFLIILFAAAVVFGAYTFFSGDSSEKVSQSSKLEYDFEITNVNQDFVDAINEGDPIRDSTRGNFMGRVISKSSRKATMLNEDLINGRYVIAEVPNAYDVVITIEAAATITPTNVIVDGQEIKVGKKFYIKGKGYANQGFVTRMAFDAQ